MKTILVLFSLFATISFGQFSSGTARRIIRDSGAPSAGTCDSLSEVSNVYVRLDSASTASPLYICTNTGVGTYGWVLSGAGGAAATVPFSGVTSATSTNDYVLGAGGTLTTTSTGINEANAIRSGTSPPSTCTVGMLFFETDQPIGQNLVGCTATDTWTDMSGGKDITFTIDGGGSVIPTGDLNRFFVISRPCTISGYKVVAVPSGSITINVWKDASTIPTAADAISGAAPIAISASQLALAGDVTTWSNKNALLNDVLGFNVATVTDVEWVQVTINCLTSFASA